MKHDVLRILFDYVTGFVDATTTLSLPSFEEKYIGDVVTIDCIKNIFITVWCNIFGQLGWRVNLKLITLGTERVMTLVTAGLQKV